MAATTNQQKELAEDISVAEVCPHCGRENELSWNVQKDGYEIFCPKCGTRMFLCSECVNNGFSCNWNSIHECHQKAEEKKKFSSYKFLLRISVALKSGKLEYYTRPFHSEEKGAEIENALCATYENLKANDIIVNYAVKLTANQNYAKEDNCS